MILGVAPDIHENGESVWSGTKMVDVQCPVSRTVAVIGDRWTVLILRDLLLRGPHKFQDLQKSLGKVGTTTLSARLKALEANGLVQRRMYSDHPPRAEYLLTEKGQSLGPIMAALRDWGRANPSA